MSVLKVRNSQRQETAEYVMNVMACKLRQCHYQCIFDQIGASMASMAIKARDGIWHVLR